MLDLPSRFGGPTGLRKAGRRPDLGVTTPLGVSGAVLLLPVQLSILGVPSPAVTPTNLLSDKVLLTETTGLCPTATGAIRAGRHVVCPPHSCSSG
jgi:hypothetical protein